MTFRSMFMMCFGVSVGISFASLVMGTPLGMALGAIFSLLSIGWALMMIAVRDR